MQEINVNAQVKSSMTEKNLFYSVVLKRAIPAERRIAFALGGYPVSLSNDKSFAAGRHPAVNKWGI